MLWLDPLPGKELDLEQANNYGDWSSFLILGGLFVKGFSFFLEAIAFIIFIINSLLLVLSIIITRGLFKKRRWASTLLFIQIIIYSGFYIF